MLASHEFGNKTAAEGRGERGDGRSFAWGNFAPIVSRVDRTALRKCSRSFFFFVSLTVPFFSQIGRNCSARRLVFRVSDRKWSEDRSKVFKEIFGGRTVSTVCAFLCIVLYRFLYRAGNPSRGSISVILYRGVTATDNLPSHPYNFLRDKTSILIASILQIICKFFFFFFFLLFLFLSLAFFGKFWWNSIIDFVRCFFRSGIALRKMRSEKDGDVIISGIVDSSNRPWSGRLEARGDLSIGR